MADRVIVTGGAGYIGSVVTSQLLVKGCEVVVYDNLSHGSRRAIPAGAKFVNGDTGDRDGLDRIFREAGADFREAGCSMCIGMNGDTLRPGEYSVSTSNRNFEGRQGKGGRTFLASPLTAAASAVTGVVTDVRTLL